MQLRPKILQIPPDNPFIEDKLSRLQSANQLTQLLSTIRDPFVLAIDSPWGTGKTTFLKMWMAQLKSNGFTCLSFNAWDTDFTGDPLVSFIGEMQSALDASPKDAKTSAEGQEYFSKGKKLLATLAKKSVPLAIKHLSQGLLDLEGLKDTGIAELAESLAKEKIEEYEADKKTIADFKIQLKKFVDQLTKEKGGQGRPLIFIIDELDRCRPPYAVDLLEKIKHLFNVENLIFVLAIDKVQIGHSIRTIYGSKMDVDGYLRRFIDLDFRLPDPPRPDFCASLYGRFNLLELERLRPNSGESIRDFVKAFSMLSDIFQLDLRTIEQCFGQFNIIYRTFPQHLLLLSPLAAFLLALRAKHPTLYDALARGTSDIDKVASLINMLPGGQEYWSSYHGLEVEAHYAMSKTSGWDTSAATAPYRHIVEQYGSDSPQGKRATEIFEVLHQLDRGNVRQGLKSAIRSIELTEPFKQT